MMNKGLFSSNSNEWATPYALFEELNAEFKFDLDPCATVENAKCKDFYTVENDGLMQNWGGAESVLQSTIRQGNFQMGKKMLGGIKKTGNVSCFANTGPNRYRIFSRLYLPQSAGNPFHSWAFAF